MIIINQSITHHTKVNPKNVQNCPFKDNLLPDESPPVDSMAMGKGGKMLVINQVITDCPKFNSTYVHSEATYYLRVH